MKRMVIIGGGAAGVFAAIAAKAAHPEASVILLEKSAVLLAKVRISGGGRCNVTHSCFEPAALSRNYPRGHKELIGPFHRFQPRDIVEWFESRGVFLKTEADGRMFPITNLSETIVECLLNEAKKVGVEIRLRQQIEEIKSGFKIVFKDGSALDCERLILATGSGAEGHRWAEKLGHTIQKPVPSLFTFNVPTSPLKALSGIAVDPVELSVAQGKFVQKGPLLLTHFGFSGPAALKLSAWGARYFHENNYQVDLKVNWLPDLTEEEIFQTLSRQKTDFPRKSLVSESLFGLPKNLWKALLENTEKKNQDLSLKELRALAHKLHADTYKIDGKTTHKEEFVTCGGVNLSEVDFKTMQSKICPGLYFAGEILDIDGVTGGFNFQNAWTTGYLAGSSP